MSSFPCPNCNNEKTSVVDTRVDFRKRKCKGCGKIFFTQEIEIQPTWTKSPFYMKALENKVKRDA